jgi:hypothetical protein
VEQARTVARLSDDTRIGHDEVTTITAHVLRFAAKVSPRCAVPVRRGSSKLPRARNWGRGVATVGMVFALLLVVWAGIGGMRTIAFVTTKLVGAAVAAATALGKLCS